MGARIDEAKRQEVIEVYTQNTDFSEKDVAKTTGICAQTVRRILDEAGIKRDKGRWNRGKPAPQLKGFTAWNKGKTKYTDSIVAQYSKTKSQQQYIETNDGYTKVWSDELKKRVREHHYIWFINTGKWPDTKNGEQIHHIDGDKQNNNFSNLILVSVAEHSAIHKKYELIVFNLIKLGMIKFDKTDNTLDASKLWKLLKK